MHPARKWSGPDLPRRVRQQRSLGSRAYSSSSTFGGLDISAHRAPLLRDPESAERIAPSGWLREFGEVLAPPAFRAFERPWRRQRHVPELLPQLHRRGWTFVGQLFKAAHDDLLESLQNGRAAKR